MDEDTEVKYRRIEVVPLVSIEDCDGKLTELQIALGHLKDELPLLKNKLDASESAWKEKRAFHQNNVDLFKKAVEIMEKEMTALSEEETMAVSEAERREYRHTQQITHIEGVIRAYQFNKVVILYTERIKELVRKGWFVYSITSATNRGDFSTYIGRSSTAWGKTSITWKIRPTVKGFRVITNQNYNDGNGKGTPYTIQGYPTPEVVMIREIPSLKRPEKMDRGNLQMSTCPYCKAEEVPILYECQIRLPHYSRFHFFGPCPTCGKYFPWGTQEDTCGYKHSYEPGHPVEGKVITLDKPKMKVKERDTMYELKGRHGRIQEVTSCPVPGVAKAILEGDTNGN